MEGSGGRPYCIVGVMRPTPERYAETRTTVLSAAYKEEGSTLYKSQPRLVSSDTELVHAQEEEEEEKGCRKWALEEGREGGGRKQGGRKEKGGRE